MSRPTTASALWAANDDIARACLAEPFVQGVATGRLPREAFVAYVGQDAVFLEAFARAYALGVARAPDRSTMEAFRALLDGVFDELGLHASFAERWGAPLDPPPLPATSAYTDFLLRVAALEPLSCLCAAMTPCMRLYAWLGRELAPVTAASSPYREWVDAYASDEFGQLATRLESLLDASVQAEAPASDAVAGRYRRAMELELGFFAAFRSG